MGIDCQVLGPPASGVEYYILGLVENMLRLDQENEYVLFAGRQAGLRQRLGPHAHVTYCESSLAASSRLGRIVWQHTRLPALARRFALDVLHCPAYIRPLHLGVPSVVTAHDTIALDHPEWCKKLNALHYGLLLQRSLMTATRVIVPSKSAAADVLRHVPQAANRVDLVPSGIDGTFRPQCSDSQASMVRRRYALPPRYVLFVGNQEPRKNLTRLIHGFRLFRQMGHPDHRLVLVGGKSWGDRSILRCTAQSDGTSDVVLPGYVRREDLPTVYSLADVLVFPSLYEGFGFPPLEAMACGTPVITSHRGALAEVPHNAAVVVDPESPQAIAQAILEVVQDRNLRGRLVVAGGQYVAQFRWNKTVEHTLRSYRLACGKGVSPETRDVPSMAWTGERGRS